MNIGQSDSKFLTFNTLGGSFWMKVVVALGRFRAPVGHRKGGCWFQVVALRRFKFNLMKNALVILQGGCSQQVVVQAGGCLSRLDCILYL